MTCFSSGWDKGSMAILVAALNMIFSTSRLNGRRFAHVSITSVGDEHNALVMWILACLCILANLVKNPFVPLLTQLSGKRNRSAAYNIFGTTTVV